MKPLDRTRFSNMKNTYESYEWIIKDDLERLDHRIREMYKEIQKWGISPERARPYVSERLQTLWEEVAQKGYEENDQDLGRKIG